MFIREILSESCLIHTHNQECSRLKMKSRLTNYVCKDECIECFENLLSVFLNSTHFIPVILFFASWLVKQLFSLCCLNIAAKF
jgi:hypothetical protein